MRRALLLTLTTTAVLSAAALPASAHTTRWHAPRCATVDSDGLLTYTRDAGKTLTATTGRATPVQYMRDVTPLADADRLLAVDQKGLLYRSGDAGCTWKQFAETDPSQDAPQISAAPDGSAYVWYRNTERLYRVTGSRLAKLPPITGSGGVVGLTADRHRVRLVTNNGRLLESYDRGNRFRKTGAVPTKGEPFVYEAAINGHSVIAGTMSEGAFITRDGGRHWRTVRMGAKDNKLNVFTVRFSPADPSVVYAGAIDIAQEDQKQDSGRHIYQSRDGGRSFRPIIDQTPGVTLSNGAELAPDPRDRNVVYFEFSTSFSNYGTDLFRFDARRGRLTKTHNSHDRLMRITFNPRYSDVMYLGFGEER